MNLRVRSYRDEKDYWRIRDFLQRVFLLNDRREFSWQVNRFDYWRWHGIANLGHGRLERNVFIWEDQDENIAAVLNSEDPGCAYLQVDPNFRTPAVELEMLSLAEEKLAFSRDNRQRVLNVFANQTDVLRQDILRSRGYKKTSTWERSNYCPIPQQIPDLTLPDGFNVRSLEDESELPARSFLSWKVFHPDDPVDDFGGWEWYLNIQQAPLYRRELDLVVISPQEEMCSFCTVWFDDATRSGAFEPVGTAAEYQRLGLGRAVMYEGLRRLQQLGADLATVGSGTKKASAFYTSIGFAESDLSEMWTKQL